MAPCPSCGRDDIQKYDDESDWCTLCANACLDEQAVEARNYKVMHQIIG